MTTAGPGLTARTQHNVGRVYGPQKVSVERLNTERKRWGAPPCENNRGEGSYAYIHTNIHINLCAPPPSGTQQRKVQKNPITVGKGATTSKQVQVEVVQLNYCYKTINW